MGLCSVGWQKNTRAPVTANASASRSGRTPSRSIGTAVARSPAALAAASAPG